MVGNGDKKFHILPQTSSSLGKWFNLMDLHMLVALYCIGGVSMEHYSILPAGTLMVLSDCGTATLVSV